MKAKQPKTGNRHTGSNMTAREAQTLVRCMRKMINISYNMNERGVYVGTRTKMSQAYQAIIDAILAGDRLEEIPKHMLLD